MLTPAKIKNHHFEAAGRNAYKADSVDRFIEEIVESYERMFRENGEMCKKIGLLAEKLEEYRNDEDNIRNALLTAQRMSEQIQREAREKAEQILTEVAAREQAENARIEAQTTELMTKAAYQARTLVEEAQKQAEQIVYDATHESKEAAITARDCMIKEEAALEMMKIEVTKFKKQILDAYNAQFALIEQLPEIACAMIEEEKAQQEAAVAEPVVEEVVAEVAEEPAAEVIEEPVAPVVEEIPEPVNEEPVEADAPVYEEISSGIEDTVDEEPIAIDTLQQMITDAEDTDAEDEIVVDDNEEEEEFFDDGAEVVMPEIDEESEADLDEIVSFFNSDSEEDTSDDIPVSKKAGFKFKHAEVEEYDDDDTDYIDELDDDDDDDDDDEGEDLASKFRNFFKK